MWIYLKNLLLIRWQRIDNACNSIKELSANCWGNYIFCDGNENMNPKAGYISVLGSILEESRVDLRLNTEVSRWAKSDPFLVFIVGYKSVQDFISIEYEYIIFLHFLMISNITNDIDIHIDIFLTKGCKTKM